jgi:hypothetical protein
METDGIVPFGNMLVKDHLQGRRALWWASTTLTESEEQFTHRLFLCQEGALGPAARLLSSPAAEGNRWYERLPSCGRQNNFAREDR